MSLRKIDKTWNKYFEQTGDFKKIEEKGYFYTTSEKLNKVGRSRIMAKMDTKHSRPEIFKNNKLSIFSVNNGKYIVFQDREERSYYDLEDLENLEIEKYNSKVNLNQFDTYPTNQNLSEAQAIDFGFISSLLSNFTSDSNLNLTIRGRHYSHSFNFTLPNKEHNVEVSGVQIEIDSGYETSRAIYLIEGKTGKRDNFHIRQLYYPYLEWENRTDKEVVPIFLTFTNGKYYLIEFSFNENFGDLSIRNKKCFTINEEPRPEIDLNKLLSQKRTTESYEIPFPQANDLDKIVDLTKIVREKNNSRKIAEYFGFERRQADYYASAAIYLGFLKRESGKLTLTSRGADFVNAKSRAKRMNLLMKAITKKESLRKILEIFYKNGAKSKNISREKITKIIATHRKDLSGTTPRRRASTIKSWLEWLENNCKFK